MKDQSVILWIKNKPNHIALANKISGEITIQGIVVEINQSQKTFAISRIINFFFDHTIFRIITAAWKNLQRYYKKKFPNLPNVSVLETNYINDEEVIQFTLVNNPTLIIVSGTSLIKKRVIDQLGRIQIINLHTGLSPYFNGGPNCTNWCIALNRTEYIGSTIMRLDAGIDSGNIITSELTPLNGNENLRLIHKKVMEHAHKIYVNAIIKICTFNTIESTPQNNISTSKTYYSKQWNFKIKMMLVYRLFNNYFNLNKSSYINSKVKTIDLIYHNTEK